MANDILYPKKGYGSPVTDAPSRPVVTYEENDNKSSKYVNLGFKVPPEFRHKIRFLAGYRDTAMVEVLREAISMYQNHYRIKVPNTEGGNE